MYPQAGRWATFNTFNWICHLPYDLEGGLFIADGTKGSVSSWIPTPYILALLRQVALEPWALSIHWSRFPRIEPWSV